MNLHPDFDDFIKCLGENRVEFVIVGAFALAFHGQPRSTGDLDIWIHPTLANAQALIKALEDFGFGKLNISAQDILSGKVVQLGYPPIRIDLLTRLDGLTPEEIWAGRVSGSLGVHHLFFLNKDQFIKNKMAVGRYKDLADVESLE